MSSKNTLITPLDICSAKKGIVLQQPGKRKKWIIVQADFVDRGFNDKHFEIEMIDYKDVQEKLPNPTSKTISIIGLGKVFERTLKNPHSFKDFMIVEKRKIKKSVVKAEIYSPKIRKTIYGESNLYTFVD